MPECTMHRVPISSSILTGSLLLKIQLLSRMGQRLGTCARLARRRMGARRRVLTERPEQTQKASGTNGDEVCGEGGAWVT